MKREQRVRRRSEPGRTTELNGFWTPDLSGGDDDEGQRSVGPADLRLHRLKTLDQRDGVGQSFTCRQRDRSV